MSPAVAKTLLDISRLPASVGERICKALGHQTHVWPCHVCKDNMIVTVEWIVAQVKKDEKRRGPRGKYRRAT